MLSFSLNIVYVNTCVCRDSFFEFSFKCFQYWCVDLWTVNSVCDSAMRGVGRKAITLTIYLRNVNRTEIQIQYVMIHNINRIRIVQFNASIIFLHRVEWKIIHEIWQPSIWSNSISDWSNLFHRFSREKYRKIRYVFGCGFSWRAQVFNICVLVRLASLRML